jgi:hypothetical protein
MINFVRSDHIKERNVKNNNMINIICNKKSFKDKKPNERYLHGKIYKYFEKIG